MRNGLKMTLRRVINEFSEKNNFIIGIAELKPGAFESEINIYGF
jgi:hypothetical protein